MQCLTRKECRHLSSRRLSVILIAAMLSLMVTMAAAAPPRLDFEKAREAITGLGRPEKVNIDTEGFEVNEQVNVTGPKAMKPGSVIVRLETGPAASSAGQGLEAAAAKLGGSIRKALDVKDRAEGLKASSAGSLRFVFLQFDEDADVLAIVKELEKVPGVMYAEPDYKFYPDAVTLPPTDTYFANGYQYYLYNDGRPYVHFAGYEGTPSADIKALPAWQFAQNDFGLDASSVVVGVIDQGVCFWIPELLPNMWVNQAEFEGTEGVDDDGNGFMDDVYGFDFYNDLGINEYDSGYFPFLDDPHGTHVAGTISSAWNGSGVAGATRNARIMSLRFLGPYGGDTSDAIEAINYAAMMGADLTNNSWGGGEPSKALADAIRAAGMLFVTSAGNDGNNNDFFGHYPSSYANPNSPYYCANVISVAATDANDNLSAYSCYGPESVHVAAPGTFILAPVPREESPYYAYSWYVGTSMASPQVASVVAMVIAQDKMHPGYSLPQYEDTNPLGLWDTVKEVVLNSAEKKAQLNGLISTGARINMYNALTWQRLPSVSSIDASLNFSNTAPVTVQLTVNLDGGAAASSVSNIEHRWSLMKIDAWWDPIDMGISVSSASTTASLTIPSFGNYRVKYEMIDTSTDTLVTTSYKPILVAEPEAVILVLDDQWHGWEDMSWYDEIGFLAQGIPYYYGILPMDLPTDIPNIVFWTTTYTTTGVINEEDAQWIIDYLRDGGRLFLASYEMLNMLEGYYGESAFDPETASELLEMLKIKGYELDHTYAVTGTLPWHEDVAAVEGDSIVWANGLDLDLEYDLWSGYLYNYGDVVTDFGPGAYPILLSLYGGGINEPDRAAYGLSYAGDDYRLIFLGVPLEALQGADFDAWVNGGQVNGDFMNFFDFIWYSYEFLMGEGPDRLTAWFENPLAGVTVSNPVDVEWGIWDVEETNHGARLWFRADEDDAWEPITLFVPGEDFGYEWDFGHTLIGSGYQVKLEVFDAADPSRVAYDFEGPFSIWPASPEEGARAGVDRDAEEIIFFINAEKPGTLYVYDLSGAMLFSEEVPAGISEVNWDMMVNGLRIARGLYAFRLVYNDGSASKTGRVLINF